VPSLRWLRRVAHRPTIVSGYEGIEEKPLRDCTDEDFRTIAAFHSSHGSMKLLFDENRWLQDIGCQFG
jgi:hypothetical protein